MPEQHNSWNDTIRKLNDEADVKEQVAPKAGWWSLSTNINPTPEQLEQIAELIKRGQFTGRI